MTALLASLVLAGCFGLDPIGSGAADSGGVTGDTGPSYSNFGGMTFPESVDFGQVELGELGTTEVVLTNESDGNVKVTEISLAAGSDFEAEFTSVPWVVGSGGQYVITLTFDPSGEGPQTGTLSFGVETETSLAEISIAAEGVTEITGGDGGTSDGGSSDGGSTTPGGLNYSHSSISFGNVSLDSSSTESVSISNSSGGDILIRDVTTNNSVFTTFGVNTPIVLSDGTSDTLEVTFTPTAEQAYNGAVDIETDVGNHRISVSGTGEYSCTICAPVIDVDTGGSSGTEMEFGSILGIPDTQSIFVFNIGDEDLVVRNVHVNNDSAFGDFEVSWSGSTTVTPGSSTSINVTYTCPDIVCLDLASELFDTNILHIESNDPTTPDWTINLNGL